MRFRTATPHDAELILRFWQESCASMAATDHVEHVRRVVSYPGTVLLLAVAEDEIIGTLLGAFDGWRGNLYRLVVHPRHRRQGIARQLVRQVEQVFAEWGVQRITALVEVDRPWANSILDCRGISSRRSRRPSCGNARRLRGTATRVKDGPQHSIRVVTGGFGEEPR